MATSGVTYARRDAQQRRAACPNAKSTWTLSRYRVRVANGQSQAAALCEVLPHVVNDGWASLQSRG